MRFWKELKANWRSRREVGASEVLLSTQSARPSLPHSKGETATEKCIGRSKRSFPWSHGQETGSKLGASSGQRSQQLRHGIEAGRDKLGPMGHVYICPSLSLATETLIAFQNPGHVLLPTNPNLANNKSNRTAYFPALPTRYNTNQHTWLLLISLSIACARLSSLWAQNVSFLLNP